MDIILQIVINISPFIIYMSLFSVYQTLLEGITISADFSMEVVSIILPAFRLFIGGLSGLSSYYLFAVCWLWSSYIYNGFLAR